MFGNGTAPSRDCQRAPTKAVHAGWLAILNHVGVNELHLRIAILPWIERQIIVLWVAPSEVGFAKLKEHVTRVIRQKFSAALFQSLSCGIDSGERAFQARKCLAHSSLPLGVLARPRSAIASEEVARKLRSKTATANKLLTVVSRARPAQRACVRTAVWRVAFLRQQVATDD